MTIAADCAGRSLFVPHLQLQLQAALFAATQRAVASRFLCLVMQRASIMNAMCLCLCRTVCASRIRPLGEFLTVHASK